MTKKEPSRVGCRGWGSWADAPSFPGEADITRGKGCREGVCSPAAHPGGAGVGTAALPVPSQGPSELGPALLWTRPRLGLPQPWTGLWAGPHLPLSKVVAETPNLEHRPRSKVRETASKNAGVPRVRLRWPVVSWSCVCVYMRVYMHVCACVGGEAPRL